MRTEWYIDWNIMRVGFLLFIIGFAAYLYFYFVIFMDFTTQGHTLSGNANGVYFGLFLMILGALFMFFSISKISIQITQPAPPPRREPELENEEIIKKLNVLKTAYEMGIIDATEYTSKREELLKKV